MLFRTRRMRPRVSSILCLPVVVFFAGPAAAQDWPQWRGVHRDGVLHSEVDLIDELPSGTLPRQWTVEIGPGYSGPTVAEGRVYVTDRKSTSDRDSQERVLCFNADTGKELWNYVYEAPYTISYTAGPRAAVTVHNGLAIAVGAMGHLHCLDAATGELRWQHSLSTEYDVQMPIWGIAAAPLVYEDTIIQIAAGAGDACVVAFNLSDGKEVWRSIDEPAGYSAPILIRQGNTDVAVCWTGASVTGLDPKTGKVFWRVPMASRNMPIGVPTPITDGEHLLVSSFYDGSLMIALDKTRPMASKQWHRVGADEKNTDALHCMIGTPLFKDGFLYGVDSYGELRCLRIDNGDRVWEDQTAVPRNRWGTIHIIQHNDREIMFNEQGELLFATLSPQGFTERSRTKLLAPTTKQLPRRGGVTWAHPAIANGFIYARSDNELVCASLAANNRSK